MSIRQICLRATNPPGTHLLSRSDFVKGFFGGAADRQSGELTKRAQRIRHSKGILDIYLLLPNG